MPYVETTPWETEQIKALLDAAEFPIVPAIHRYGIHTDRPNGMVLVVSETNDDNDDGYPDGRWDTWSLEFPTLESALKHTGICRVGISGVIVTVSVDGKEIR